MSTSDKQRPKGKYRRSRSRYRSGSRYSHPVKECDIVMNGGLAAGIIYPAAVCELAKGYRFRNICGSSVGAAAAAATAAAEKGRKSKDGGFNALEKTLAWLTSTPAGERETNLLRLLQPEAKTKKYFNILRAAAGKPLKAGYIAAAFSSLFQFPLTAVLSLVPGLFMAAVSLLSGNAFIIAVGLMLGLITIIALPPAATLLRAVNGFERALASNHFGLCTGNTTAGRGGFSLTGHLTELFNKLAGNRDKNRPLTFGDFWGLQNKEGEREINLELLTTNLSRGIPVRLPFEEEEKAAADEIYYFRPEEMEAFFPPEVVKWMVTKSRKNHYYHRVKGYLPLPEPGDIPVVFAVRLSLGFPPLMSAVPLYKMKSVRRKRRTYWQMIRFLFADGSIAGGCSVNYFDKPLPVRPSFALNLMTVPEGAVDPNNHANNVWVQSQLYEKYPVSTGGTAGLAGLLRTVGRAAMKSEENLLLEIPGYRERIGVVRFAEKEGTFSFNPDGESLNRLARRAAEAASQLSRRFQSEQALKNTLSWDTHRWIRFRSTMAQLESYLHQLKTTYLDSPHGEPTYDHLLMRPDGEPPDAYRWSDVAHRNHALRVTSQLLDLVGRWQQDLACFSSGNPPRPMAQLRHLPRP